MSRVETKNQWIRIFGLITARIGVDIAIGYMLNNHFKKYLLPSTGNMVQPTPLESSCQFVVPSWSCDNEALYRDKVDQHQANPSGRWDPAPFRPL